MSILHPVPKHMFGTVFTHHGRAYGVVPVYIGDPESDEPRMAVSNWIPEWPLDLMQALHELSAYLGVPDSGVPVYIGKKIEVKK